MSGRVKSELVKSGHVKVGQVKLGQVDESRQVKSGYKTWFFSDGLGLIYFEMLILSEVVFLF